MSNEEAGLAHEIEDSSRALLEALEHQDPRYLEHLDRRQRALVALHHHTQVDWTAEERRGLEEGLRLGEEAASAVLRMQERTRRQLLTLGQERSFTRALETQVEPQYRSLNVKA